MLFRGTKNLLSIFTAWVLHDYRLIVMISKDKQLPFFFYINKCSSNFYKVSNPYNYHSFCLSRPIWMKFISHELLQQREFRLLPKHITKIRRRYERHLCSQWIVKYSELLADSSKILHIWWLPVILDDASNNVSKFLLAKGYLKKKN